MKTVQRGLDLPGLADTAADSPISSNLLSMSVRVSSPASQVHNPVIDSVGANKNEAVCIQSVPVKFIVGALLQHGMEGVSD